MSSTYTSSNKFEKPTTGEQSGTWGQTVDNNYDLIDQAIDGYAAITIPSGSTTIALNIANGQTSAARSRWLVFSGSPSSTVTIQIVQNTIPRWWFVRNDTNQLLVFAGAGTTTATIPALSQGVIFSDGTSGVYDLLNVPGHTIAIATLRSGTINSNAYIGGTLALTGGVTADNVVVPHAVNADTVTANSSITAPVVNATTLNVPNLSVGAQLSVPSLSSAGDVKAKTLTATSDPVQFTILSPGLGASGSALRGHISTFQITASANGSTGANQPMIQIQVPGITANSVVMLTPANQATTEVNWGTGAVHTTVTPGVGFTVSAGSTAFVVPTQAVGQVWASWNYLVIL